MKKVFIYVIGTLILSPVVIGFAMSIEFAMASVMYGVGIVVTAAISEPILGFWEKYIGAIDTFCKKVFAE